jgi:hypothetical protein
MRVFEAPCFATFRIAFTMSNGSLFFANNCKLAVSKFDTSLIVLGGADEGKEGNNVCFGPRISWN